MPTSVISRTLGKYRIDAVLGKGAMGTVYRSYDPVLARPVAIKTLHRALIDDGQNDFLERFRTEAKAAAAFDHPNIVTIHEYGEDDGTPYIVMELLEGEDLRVFLKRNGLPELTQTLDIMRQVLAALAYCHAHGVVHRDLKPANIVLLPDARVKLTDFGIAHIQDSGLTQIGDQLGTLAYMSPEQYLGEPVDARSDLFTAGIVLYELLTGKQQPLTQTLSDLADATANGGNGGLPPAVTGVLRKALAKRPTDRFQRAEEFAEAMMSVETTEEPTVVYRPPRPNKKPNKWKRGALLALLIVVPLLGWQLWEIFGSQQPVAPPGGTVHVISWPPGAIIWQADQQLGTTPQRLELSAGRHDIALKLDGYQDINASLEVESGAEMDFELPLVPLDDFDAHPGQ